MPHRTFFWFILPSALAMLLFIALPIVSVTVQSLYLEHEQVLIEVENCGPFKCETSMQVDTQATAALREAEPLGRFVGLDTYLDRGHLAVKEVGEIWDESSGIGDFFSQLVNLPFYKALTFTLTYLFVVTPCVIILGFAIALAVNMLTPALKGPVIFASLLPMIITPLIGSLILFWMVDARGIIGSGLQSFFDDPDLSLKASTALTWIMLCVYGIWHSAPFAFVVFYAGLQTVPQDTLESAMIDGANRWERVRYVVIPYIMPLVTFVALMQMMDNFRIFEPIIGFSSAANANSLSWLIYNDLRGSDGVQRFGSAASTSMLTIIGVVILLTPVLIRSWRNFNRAN